MAAGASSYGLFTATFLASLVEFVEAFTIVLAIGMTRSWRSTLLGVGAAVLALASATVLAGYALVNLIPESLLQLVIGTLLLIFGLQWLRKAILRAAGVKQLHDEGAIFLREKEEAQSVAAASGGIDWFSFVVAFKGVFLEGLEVMFIVITFGLNAGDVPLAAGAALLAGLVVLVVGTLLHAPLTRIPENTLKFAVGILLTTFGTFWTQEGLGIFTAGGASIHWPGHDLAILYLLLAWVSVSLLAVRVLRSEVPPERKGLSGVEETR